MQIYPANSKRLLFDLTSRVIKLFDQFNVRYSISGGTLLSCVRDGGKFIPWDYDVDFDCPKFCDYDENTSNWKRFYKLIHHLRAHPYLGVGVTLKLPQIVKLTHVVPRGLQKDFGFDVDTVPNATLDVFMMEGDPKGGHRLVAGQFPNWRYGPGELLPLRSYTFEGMSVWGPQSPKNILRRYYGKWENPVFKTWPVVEYGKNKQNRTS